MNKKDLIVVIPLVVLALAWGPIYSRFFAKPQPAVELAEPTIIPRETEFTAPKTELESKVSESVAALQKTLEAIENADKVVLENENVSLTLSSAGGSVVKAILKDYTTEKNGTNLVTYTFNDSPALSYVGMSEISAKTLMATQKIDDKTVVFTKVLSNGLTFMRRITLGDSYSVDVNDQLINPTDAPIVLPPLSIGTGFIPEGSVTKQMQGIPMLGVDSLVGKDLNYWGNRVNKFFKKAGTDYIDVEPDPELTGRVNWVSAKNKFFAQVLIPHEGIATQFHLMANKEPGKRGKTKSIASSVSLDGKELGVKETRSYKYTYYIGPKDYEVLKATGYQIEDVMEFRTVGFWSGMNFIMEPARKSLLWLLVTIHKFIPNYGVAIILLTMIVRGIFWPLTHKSTESMKRMSELQPKIKALQEKYKENTQVMQQETMKLYRENKVNPAAGCLPIMVQIPIFFALYTVLRSAIELRFAGFLWIPDLSEPENLFAGMIPLIGSLNILPLLMTGTTVLQQHLTPTSADPQQKQMMMLVPIMMLFIFYNMPSGLTLYWTTSNVAMIVQMLIRNWRDKKKA